MSSTGTPNRVVARNVVSDPDRTIQVQQLTVSPQHKQAITKALEEGRASQSNQKK
jgi:hypothetical protein